MAGGIFQAADDIARIVANGATFGGADALATWAGDKNAAAKTAAARDRAGLAGDIGSVLGPAGGFVAGFKALKALPAMGRAIMSKKGLAAGGLGLGTLVQYNARTTPEAPDAPKAAPQPKAQAKPAAKPAAKPQDAAAALKAVEEPSSADLAALGALSYRQLNALAEAQQRMTPKAGRTPSARDTALAQLMAYNEAAREAAIAGKVIPKYDQDYAANLERYIKLDPMAAYMQNLPQVEEGQ